MRSKILQELLDETPKDSEIFVRWYAAIVLRVNQLMKEKGLTQKALAERLDKTPSEIHKWLSGEHNLTLRSLAKLEAELGEPILIIPQNKKETEFISYGSIGSSTTVKVEQNTDLIFHEETGWKYSVTSNILANAS